MKKLLSLLIIAALVFAGVVLVKKRKMQLAMEKPAPVLPVVVDTITLKQQPVTLTLPAMGVVGSEFSTTLSTKVSGQIIKVFKQEGDQVKQGELLAKIDASDLTAKKQGLLLKKQGISFQIDAVRQNIKALETSLASARETHLRTKELFAVKGASIEQVRQEEANLAKIEAQLSAARNQIATLKKNQESINQNIKEIESISAYANVTSPISGTLSERMIKAGDMAMPGKPLFRIASGQGFYINLFLPESVHPRQIIFRGQRLSVSSKNQASKTGLVQYIASIPGEVKLVEGQYVSVNVVTHEALTSLVPRDGLLMIGGKSYVFEVNNGKALQTPVDIAAKGSEGVVLEQDLEGKTIITAKPDILLRVSAGVPILTTDEQNKQMTANEKPAERG